MPHGVLVPREVRRGFWAGVRSGLSPSEAAVAVGASESAGRRWIINAGGVLERASGPTGLRLNLTEREEIAHWNAQKLSYRAISEKVGGRHASTIMREITLNGGRERYRPSLAQARAENEARRPKRSKLAANPVLRERVEQDLEARYSPEQIAGRLRREFPENPEMRVHHETIYRDLFVLSRGSLRAELAADLRKGRVRRVRREQQGKAKDNRGRIPDMVMIADRPSEVDERVVPGHWEGDLITGKNNASAIGVLVERTTNFTLLLHLPDGHGATQVTAAITAAMAALPEQLRRSLTWDQGKELAKHKQIAETTGLAVYFCHPHSPWERPSSENTNGLLRQYFPKGSDLSVHSREDLAWVQNQFNDRPRKRLEYAKPSELINDLLLR